MLSVVRFLGNPCQNGGTEYRNRRTGDRYAIEPLDYGVTLFKNNNSMTSFPVSRREALCLIELDDFPRSISP